MIEIFQESTVFDLYIDDQKKHEFQPEVVLESFAKLAWAITYEPDVNPCHLDVLSSLDKKRLIDLNSKISTRSPDNPVALHALIGKNYRLRMENIALLSTTERMTYAELGQQSATVAHLLNSQGVKSGGSVGICMDRTIFSIVSLLGILRAGAAYVPMDSFHPAGRIAQIVEKADIKYVVTDRSMSQKFQNLPVTLVMPSWSTKEIPSNWSEETSVDPSNPVYVMFTSGSTGTPKGVIHGHSPVSQSVLECIKDFKIDSSTRFMQGASLAFDASILEVFAPLVVGGCLCMPSQDERNGHLESAMRKMRVTDAWMSSGLTTQIQPQNLPDLRSLSVGGESPPKEALSAWAPHVQFNNFYGLTEAGVWDTFKSCMKPGDDPKNIGQGIGRASCWIVDPSNVHRLRPFGAEGELVIQSPYLAIGYLQDREKQSASFLDISSLKWRSMTSAHKGSRIYRTGDLAKFNEGGDIIFIGRQNGFVKIRGLRVDLGEIERVINSKIETGRSAVVVSDADPSNVEIVAFVEAESPSQNGHFADTMHDLLSDMLSSYMIPSIFIPIESLPLTASKKLDRQGLRQRLSKMGQSELLGFRKGGYGNITFDDIPETRSTALDLSNTVADMLRSKDLEFALSLSGRNFPLDAVGLTSMQFVTLCNMIKKKYGKDIKVQDIRQASLDVLDLEELVLSGSTKHASKSKRRDLLGDLDGLVSQMSLAHLRGKSVFLTSITGFLGSQILRNLLERKDIDHIIGLVRADNIEKAKEKVQEQGEIGKWWQPEFHNRIEIVLGDLAKPYLGLQKTDWNRLFSEESGQKIDGLIHNGAKVNWMDNYESLERVNVQSTVTILSAMASMMNPFPLVYVSGGYMPGDGETHTDVARVLSDSCGYDQTKFMSELLITEYNKHLDWTNPTAPKARTIIPGFIVGTQKEGIAHTEDFLWRLAFSIVRLRAVDRDPGHLAVAGVDQISGLISDCIFQRGSYSTRAMRLSDGVSTNDLCQVLSENLNVNIKEMDHEEWMRLLREDVEGADFEHPFAPVLTWFEDNIRDFMSAENHPLENKIFENEGILKSLQSSVNYLQKLGYFVGGSQGSGSGSDKIAIFKRSE